VKLGVVSRPLLAELSVLLQAALHEGKLLSVSCLIHTFEQDEELNQQRLMKTVSIESIEDAPTRRGHLLPEVSIILLIAQVMVPSGSSQPLTPDRSLRQ
jgi:hypothetical protein